MAIIMQPKTILSASIVLKTSFIALCLLRTFGLGYPPAAAQPVLTVEDAVQDSKISEINEHLKATDGRADQYLSDLHKVANDVAGMQGENRIAYSVIAAIASTSLVVTWRKKSA